MPFNVKENDELSHRKGVYGELKGRINQYVVVNLHREFRYGSQRPTKDSLQSCHQNSNIFLLRLIDGIKQTRKLSSLLSCLFD